VRIGRRCEDRGVTTRAADPATHPPDRVAAVLLAAGGSVRFGAAPKLRAVLAGRPLVTWALAGVLAAGFGEVIVVTGAVALDDLLPDGVTVVPNPRWPEGLATSLAAAVAHVAERADGPDRPDRLVVGLGDQPAVGSAAWAAVAAAPGPVAVATYDGHRRNPVALDRAVWDLLPATGEEGARALMRSRPELVHEVPCVGDPFDIDTVDDLARRNGL
jgi:molybdenum cofactor cytidylyltransferase